MKTIELPEELYHRLETEATRRGVPLDDLIAEGLHLLLEEPARSGTDTANPKTSLHEAMRDCCGIATDTPRDYATNPKYMEGFGE